MRRHLPRLLVGSMAVLSLLATACGGSDSGSDTESTASSETAAGSEGSSAPSESGSGAAAPADGPTITVASFNFPESVILAEIYAQALENQGYPVETNLDLGSRELILPDLESGSIDLLPEYVGSALGVGFGGEPTADTQETLEMLQQEYDEIGVTALEPAPGQDKNVFVTTQEFAEQNDLETISDLADLDSFVLGGAPECRDRDTCLAGLENLYGLDNIEFQVIQEAPIRVSSLANGQIDVSLLFSTQPVIRERDFVALEDDQGMIPAENIVPVVNDEVLEAYGEDFRSFVNSITAEIETETLIELNGKVELDAEDPDQVAQTWLEENGFLDG